MAGGLGTRWCCILFLPLPLFFFLSECCCILKRPLAGSIQPVKKLHKKILRCSTQGHASVTTWGFQTFCSLPRFNGRAQPSTWSCPQKVKAVDSLIIQNASQILHFASSLEHFPQTQPSFPWRCVTLKPSFTLAEPVHPFDSLTNIYWAPTMCQELLPTPGVAINQNDKLLALILQTSWLTDSDNKYKKK